MNLPPQMEHYVHPRNPLRRRRLLGAALTVVVALAAAPAAGAATFGGGSVDLKFSSSFSKVLKKAKAKAKGTGGASTSGKTVSFPVDGGSVGLTAPFNGSLTLTGGLEVKAGKKKVTLTNLTDAIAGTKGSIKSGSSTVLDQKLSNKLKVAGDFSGLSGNGITLSLTSSGAKSLNKKLKTKAFKKGQVVGTSKVDAERRLAFSSGVKLRLTYDQATRDKMTACGITTTANPPANDNPPSGSEPRGSVDFPIKSSSVNAVSLFGSIVEDGGVHLQGASHMSDLSQITIQRDASGATVTAFASDVNNTVPIGDLDLSSGSFTKNLTADGGTLTLSNGSLKLNAAAAALLQGQYGCSTVHAGDPLGTMNASGPVS